MRHVVITGGTGFIGAALVRTLLARGVRVTVLLRPTSDTARLSRVSGWEAVHCTRLAYGDAFRSLKRDRPDIFFHCAWRGVAGGDRNEGFQVTENIPLTIDSVELGAAIGCRHWIGFGSQAEYGNLNCRISEDCLPHPTTLYGRAKLAAGIASVGLCAARGLAASWIRVFSVYGPGEEPNWMLSYAIRELLGNRVPRLTKCEQRWDYLYIDDAVGAAIDIARSAAEGVFNLGSGRALPLREVVETMVRLTHSTARPAYGALPYRNDQVMHLEADVSRLQAATGWSPRISIEDGMAAMIAAIRGDENEIARE